MSTPQVIPSPKELLDFYKDKKCILCKGPINVPLTVYLFQEITASFWCLNKREEVGGMSHYHFATSWNQEKKSSSLISETIYMAGQDKAYIVYQYYDKGSKYQNYISSLPIFWDKVPKLDWYRQWSYSLTELIFDFKNIDLDDWIQKIETFMLFS